MVDHHEPTRSVRRTSYTGQFSRFNARCPLHQRRCKCHSRRKLVQPPPASTGTIPFAGSVSTFDCTTLRYLRDCANLELSGYTTGTFWEGLVLQACQMEPAVRCAAIAVGDAHLEHCSFRRFSAQTQEKYQKALVSLRDYVNTDANPSHSVVLICCILLFTFDKLRQNWEAAGVHLQGALSIRNEIGRRGRATTPESSSSNVSAPHVDEVSLMLLKMDMEATISEPIIPRVKLKAEEIGLGAAYRHAGWSKHMSVDTPLDLTKPWLILSHDCWEHVSTSAVYRALPVSEVPQHIIDTRVRLEAQCEEVFQAIQAWKRSNPEPDPALLTTMTTTLLLDPRKKETEETRVRHAIIVLTLESHHFVISRMIEQLLQEVHVQPTTRRDDHDHPLNKTHTFPDHSSSSSSSSTFTSAKDPLISPWDRQPSQLLAIGAKVLTLRKLHRKMRALDNVLERTFSAHIGVIEPLILLAHRTGDDGVRRRAVDLIRQCEEIEGLSGLSPECIQWVQWLQSSRRKRDEEGDGGDGDGIEAEGVDEGDGEVEAEAEVPVRGDGGGRVYAAWDIYSHKTRPRTHLPSAAYLQKNLLFGDFPS